MGWAPLGQARPTKKNPADRAGLAACWVFMKSTDQVVPQPARANAAAKRRCCCCAKAAARTMPVPSRRTRRLQTGRPGVAAEGRPLGEFRRLVAARTQTLGHRRAPGPPVGGQHAEAQHVGALAVLDHMAAETRLDGE